MRLPLASLTDDARNGESTTVGPDSMITTEGAAITVGSGCAFAPAFPGNSV
jgi:hypothetical protein